MIKSFKDFDDELKGQKIYEAVDEDIRENDDDIFTEEDVVVPNLLSDNKFLLKISRIVLKKLRQSNLGSFGVYPIIITIDGRPGVRFYNYDDPTMNIIICRNTMGKHAYLFREFTMGKQNVADLVLSTTKLGFSDIIDTMISNITPSDINESWSYKDTYATFDDGDIEKAKTMDKNIRKLIVKLYTSIPGVNINKVYLAMMGGDSVSESIRNEIGVKFGKLKDATVKKVAVIFGYALGIRTTGDASKDKNIREIVDDLREPDDPSTPTPSLITSKKDVTVYLDDETKEELEEARKKELEKDTEQYMRDMDKIYTVASMMCKYVKNNCHLDNNDWGKMRSRGMLITGKAGTGKSFSIEKALKDMGMKKNIDYFNVSSGNTASGSLYKKLYDYNGKLIIFDDTAGLFDAGYKMSFWKFALESNIENAVVELSQDAKNGENIGDNIYVPGKLTRQQRYFAEIGRSTPKEKTTFIDDKMKRLEDIYRKETGDTTALTKTKEAEFKLDAEKAWNEHEEKKKPKMPNRFNFKGVVIIISNTTRKEFRKEVGTDNWEAITRRMRNFDLHPEAESIWVKIKETILKQSEDPSITDDERLIPIHMVDEFCKEVEELLKQPTYRNINFGFIANDMHKIFLSPDVISTWKEELKDLLNINK